MSAWKRLLIATTVMLSGLLLLPFVALPGQAFSWELFTGAYGSAPALGVNQAAGAPGSFFTVSGYNFPAGQSVAVSVNDQDLGEVTADAGGDFSFILATAGADPGLYTVRVSYSIDGGLTETTLATRFELVAGGTVWPQEGTGTVFVLQPGLTSQSIFLPMLAR